MKLKLVSALAATLPVCLHCGAINSALNADSNVVCGIRLGPLHYDVPKDITVLPAKRPIAAMDNLLRHDERDIYHSPGLKLCGKCQQALMNYLTPYLGTEGVRIEIVELAVVAPVERVEPVAEPVRPLVRARDEGDSKQPFFDTLAEAPANAFPRRAKRKKKV